MPSVAKYPGDAFMGSSIERGDGKPTAGSYEVYKLLAERLAAEQTKLDGTLKADLPAVNRMLVERKLKELVPTTAETPEPKPAAAAPGN